MECVQLQGQGQWSVCKCRGRGCVQDVCRGRGRGCVQEVKEVVGG